MLHFYYQPPLVGEKPQRLVVLLHGLGADGQDLMDLAKIWGEALPDAGFVSPNAPFPCDMAPFGYQWFSLQDRRPEAMSKGVDQALPILQNFLHEITQKYAVPGGKVILMGFSQGAMMSFHVGLQRPEGCEGIMAYSGIFLGLEKTPHKVPVLVVHGDEDAIVPPQMFQPTVDALKNLDLTVHGHFLSGLGHGIDARGIALGQKFLKQFCQ